MPTPEKQHGRRRRRRGHGHSHYWCRCAYLIGTPRPTGNPPAPERQPSRTRPATIPHPNGDPHAPKRPPSRTRTATNPHHLTGTPRAFSMETRVRMVRTLVPSLCTFTSATRKSTGGGGASPPAVCLSHVFNRGRETKN